jgi:hypothetical protein
MNRLGMTDFSFQQLYAWWYAKGRLDESPSSLLVILRAVLNFYRNLLKHQGRNPKDVVVDDFWQFLSSSFNNRPARPPGDGLDRWRKEHKDTMDKKRQSLTMIQSPGSGGTLTQQASPRGSLIRPSTATSQRARSPHSPRTPRTPRTPGGTVVDYRTPPRPASAGASTPRSRRTRSQGTPGPGAYERLVHHYVCCLLHLTLVCM